MTRFAPRDLRRSFKSHAIAKGIGKEALDLIQNHAQSDVSAKHFTRYRFLKEKREALVVWKNELAKMVGA